MTIFSACLGHQAE